MNELEKHRLDADMSETGLNRRLRRLADLYQLAISLKKAQRIPTESRDNAAAVREPPTAYPAAKREP